MFVVCACARFQVTPKVSHLHAVKRIFRYLKGKQHLGLWYPKDSPFDLVAYFDSDYAGVSLDRKSTTKGCQFLGCRLISWQCKKQTVVVTSSTEVEYVAGASYYTQVLWIQNQMLDYREALRLDDAEGVDCLPNEEIFTELARMGYEKPSAKLTFYKAFFLSQWKFIIHTILQSMSAKRTSWNEFSSAMASAVICLSTGDLSTHTSKYISPALTQKGDAEEQGNDDNAAEELDTVVSKDDVENQSIPSPSLPTPPPQQPQDIPSTSQAQSTPPQLQSPTPAPPQGADFPMSLLQKALDGCAALTRRVEHQEHDKVPQDLEIIKLKTKVKKLERANKGRMIDELDRDEGVVLMSEKEAEEVKDITVKVAIPSTRQRRGVVIRDPEEESSIKTTTETKSKDKGKGIMVEEPKPMKKKQEVELDEAYARKIHEKLNQDIDWEVAMDHVKQKAKEIPYVQRYQVMKKRPQTEAQARRNMMVYLKNTVGFRFDYFKGMSYDDIRSIFKAMFNYNIEFLLKSKEQIEEEENRAIESINETPA
nr:hypothetical protein [Tanacetum cinerariifolium]